MPTFPIADQVFLLGHDPDSGKPTVSGELLAIAIAGGALGEALLTRRLLVDGGRLVARGTTVTGDPVADAVTAAVARQGDGHTVRTWVEFLCPDIRDLVGQRLVAEGVVTRARGGLLGRGATRYPAEDSTRFWQPRLHLSYLLDKARPIDLETAAVAALARAASLERQLEVQVSRMVLRDRIAGLERELPPSLRQLLAGVHAAVAAMALTVRR